MPSLISLFTPKNKIAATEEEKKRHKAVEKSLKEAKTRHDQQSKVLLLGGGDSGKSTVLKQMRLIHGIAFTAPELESYRHLVFSNLVDGMRLIIEALSDFELTLHSSNEELYLEHFDARMDIRDGEVFPRAWENVLERLWKDPAVQKAWARANEVALPENLSYFFSHLPRLFQPDYSPTPDDILHARARTIGISETLFRTRNREVLMVDVGGQKSERRKWIHCFQDVTCLLFLTSLSGYDMCLVEDRASNQMQDSMQLWDEICKSQWFKKTSLMLFLNKEDIFRKKVKCSDISRLFPDFPGQPRDHHAGKDYFKQRFVGIYKKTEATQRQLYIHFTTATDTRLLRVVMSAVEDVILSDNVREVWDL